MSVQGICIIVLLIGWLVAAFINSSVGGTIFCLAAVFLSLKFLVSALKEKSYSKFEKVWNLVVAGVFLWMAYASAKILIVFVEGP